MVNKDNRGLVLPLRVDYKIIDDFKESLSKRPWEYLEEGNYEKYLKLTEPKKDISVNRKELIAVYADILKLLKDKQNHINSQFVNPRFDLVKHEFKCICKNTYNSKYSLQIEKNLDNVLAKQPTTRLKHGSKLEADVQINELNVSKLSKSYKPENTIIESSRPDSEANVELKDPVIEEYFDTNAEKEPKASVPRAGTKVLRVGTNLVRGGTRVHDLSRAHKSRDRSQTKVKFDSSDDVKNYDVEYDRDAEVGYESNENANNESDVSNLAGNSDPEISKKQTYNSEYLMQLPSLDLELLHSSTKDRFKQSKKAKKDSADDLDHARAGPGNKAGDHPVKDISGSGERVEKNRNVLGEKMDKKPVGERITPLYKLIADEKISNQEAEMKSDLMHLLESVPVFSDLPKNRLLELSKQFKLRSFFTNSSVILAGEFPQEFFIVSSGIVSSYRYESNALYNVYQRSYLSSDYFGEIFLMDNVPSDEFYIADSHVTVQAMSANTFKTLLADKFEAFRNRLKEFTNYGTCKFNTIAVPSRFFTNVELDKFASNDDVVKAHRVIGPELVSFLKKYTFLSGFKNLERLAKRFSYHQYLPKEILEGISKRENLFLVFQGVVSLQVYEEEFNTQLEMMSFVRGSYFLTSKFNSDVLTSIAHRISYVAKERLVLLRLEQKYLSKYLRESLGEMALYLENLYKSKYLRLEKTKYIALHREKIVSSESDGASASSLHHEDDVSASDKMVVEDQDETPAVASYKSHALKSRSFRAMSLKTGTFKSESVVSESGSLASGSFKSSSSKGSLKCEQKIEHGLTMAESAEDDDFDDGSETVKEDELAESEESSEFSSSSHSESKTSSRHSSGPLSRDECPSVHSKHSDPFTETNSFHDDDGSATTLDANDDNTSNDKDSESEARTKNDSSSFTNDTVALQSKADSAMTPSEASSGHTGTVVLDKDESFVDEVSVTGDDESSAKDEVLSHVSSESGVKADSSSLEKASSVKSSSPSHLYSSRSLESTGKIVSRRSFEEPAHVSIRSSIASQVESSRSFETTAKIVSRRSFEDPSLVSIRSSIPSHLESSRTFDSTAKIVSRRSFDEPADVSIRSSIATDMESARISDIGAKIVSRRSFEDPVDVSIRSSLHGNMDSSRTSESVGRIVSRRSTDDPVDVSIRSSLFNPLDSFRTVSSVLSNEPQPSMIPTIYENPEDENIDRVDEEASSSSFSFRPKVVTNVFSDSGEKIVSRRSFEEPADVSIRSSIPSHLESSRSFESAAKIVSRRSFEDPALVSIRSSIQSHLTTLSSRNDSQPNVPSVSALGVEPSRPADRAHVDSVMPKSSIKSQVSLDNESFSGPTQLQAPEDNYGEFIKKLSGDYEMIRKNTLMASHINIPDTEISARSKVSLLLDDKKASTDGLKDGLKDEARPDHKVPIFSSFNESMRTHSFVLDSSNVGRDSKDSDLSSVASDVKFVFNLDKIRKQRSGASKDGEPEDELDQKPDSSRVLGNDNFVDIRSLTNTPVKRTSTKPVDADEKPDVNLVPFSSDKKDEISNRVVHRQTSSSYLLTSRTLDASFDPNDVLISNSNEHESFATDKYASSFEEKPLTLVEFEKPDDVLKSSKFSVKSESSKLSLDEPLDSLSRDVVSKDLLYKDVMSKDFSAEVEKQSSGDLSNTVGRSEEQMDKSPSLDFAEIPNITKIISRVHSLYANPELPNHSVSGSKFSSIDEVYLQLDKIEKLYPPKSPAPSISPRYALDKSKSGEVDEKPTENIFEKLASKLSKQNTFAGTEAPHSLLRGDSESQLDLNDLYRQTSYTSMNTLTNMFDSEQNRNESLNTDLATDANENDTQFDPAFTNEMGPDYPNDAGEPNDAKDNKFSISFDSFTRELSFDSITRVISVDSLSENLSFENIKKELSNIGSSISSHLSRSFSSNASEANEVVEEKQLSDDEDRGPSLKESSKLIISSIFDNIPLYSDKSDSKEAADSDKEPEISDVKKEVDKLLSDKNVFIDKYNLFSRLSFDSSSIITSTSSTDDASFSESDKVSASNDQKEAVTDVRTDPDNLSSSDKLSFSSRERDSSSTPLVNADKIGSDSSLSSLKRDPLLTTGSSLLTSESAGLTSENEDKFSLVTTEKDEEGSVLSSEKPNTILSTEKEDGEVSLSSETPSNTDSVYSGVDRQLEQSPNYVSNLITDSESHLSSIASLTSNEPANDLQSIISESNEDNNSIFSFTSESTFNSRKSGSIRSKTSSLDSFNSKTSSVESLNSKNDNGDVSNTEISSVDEPNSRTASNNSYKNDESGEGSRVNSLEGSRTNSVDGSYEGSDRNDDASNSGDTTDDDVDDFYPDHAKFVRYDSDKYGSHGSGTYGEYNGFDETMDSEDDEFEYDEESILSIKNLLISTLKNKYKSLGAAFVAMDYERTGNVSREAFLGFLEKLGIGAIDHREQNLMFELLKQEGQGYITFASFYACSGEAVNTVEELNQHFISIYGSSRFAFERFFTALKKSTKCSKVDFVAILAQVGVGEEKAVKLFEQLDVCNVGSVTVFTMLKLIVGDWERASALEYEEKLNTNLNKILTYLSPESVEDFNTEFTKTLSSHFFDQAMETWLVTPVYEEFYIDRELRYFDELCSILDEHKQFKTLSPAQKRFAVSLFNLVDTSLSYGAGQPEVEQEVTLISSSETDPPLVALVNGNLDLRFDGFTYPKNVSFNTPCLANYAQFQAYLDKYTAESSSEDADDPKPTSCGYSISFKVGAGSTTVVGILPMTSYFYNLAPMLHERNRKVPVIMQFLKCIPSFSVYTPEELERIVYACTVREFKLHESVIKAGEVPTHFYVIFDGSLTVNNEFNFELKTLSKSDFFSSYDIVNNKVNDLTLNANGTLILLSWERNEFFRVFTRYATLVENDACNLSDSNNLTLQKFIDKKVSFAGFS